MSCVDVSKYKYLGHGKNGKVYLMPDGKVIKICKREDRCLEEYKVLKIAEGSSYFPKVYERKGKNMIREYVDGYDLNTYIKKYGLSKNLVLNLIGMVEEFKKLGFKRLDMRGVHIYVTKDEKVKVIDPSMQLIKTVKYPELMIRDLKNLGVIGKFFNVLKDERPDLYKKWSN
ncbi:serine/threonine protein kinase [Clostridium drakei]|uniref:Serine/threonine protein kinase n=1 Tax=Clostridium drakei TaxID=332101 RepID=A0A2U8DKJ6_9CLOT|nr:serine/threonine protein kinase [Clostridium drakei]AWI03280.1 serine/threonine protein kinase [Clostridium drakei]